MDGRTKHRILGNEAYHPTTFYTSKSLSARLRNSCNRLSLSRDFSFASACYLAAMHEHGEDRRRWSFKYVVLLDPNDSLWIALSNSSRACIIRRVEQRKSGSINNLPVRVRRTFSRIIWNKDARQSAGNR